MSTVGQRTLTKGILRSAYLVRVDSAAVSHVVPLVYYNGSYPTAPLDAGGADAGPWTVAVAVHLVAPAAVAGTVSVTGTPPAGLTVTVSGDTVDLSDPSPASGTYTGAVVVSDSASPANTDSVSFSWSF